MVSKTLYQEINAIYALTSAQNNSGVDKLFHDIGNKFLDPNFQEKVADANVEKGKDNKNNVKLDKKQVSEKNKEQKQKKKSPC